MEAIQYGTYRYQHPEKRYPKLILAIYKMHVQVVGSKGDRYQIKYLQTHANGAKPGSLHWVSKDKVKLIDPPHDPLPDLNIRLPYKD